MNIGKRLRELREAKGLSQGDIERWTGLARSYVSRIENGHGTPSLRLLQKWADAVEVELYQLFFAGHSQPEPPALRTPPGARERTLLRLFSQMTAAERTLVISLARDLAKRKGKRG